MISPRCTGELLRIIIPTALPPFLVGLLSCAASISESVVDRFVATIANSVIASGVGTTRLL